MELTPDWPPPSPPSGSSRAAQHNSNTTTTGAAATPPPPSRKPASKRRLAVLSHPPLPSASFPPSHSFTFHSLPFTSLLPPRRKRRDERGRGGGWRERTKGSEGYILCPLGFVPREENHHPSILLSLCSYSFLFYHRAYFVSLSLLPELGWINKETPTNSSIENSAILFSRFSPKLYLFLLPSFSFLYISLFLFPILPGLTRRLSSFQRIREHRYSRSTPISGGIAADGKQPNFSWSSESLVLIGLPLERSFVFWIIFFSTSISRGRKFILFFRINEKINSAAELNRTLCSHCNHF